MERLIEQYQSVRKELARQAARLLEVRDYEWEDDICYMGDLSLSMSDLALLIGMHGIMEHPTLEIMRRYAEMLVLTRLSTALEQVLKEYPTASLENARMQIEARIRERTR